MNLKKYTRKDRYGNSITIELDTMQQPTVPSMNEIPHPGGPKGTDTVPAWLTPGEFVMNAEATRMYEPQIKAMNEHGRAIQRQQGGTIPEPVTMPERGAYLPDWVRKYALEQEKKVQRKADGGMIQGDEFQRYADAIRYAENNLSHYDDAGNVARSKDNAIGMMQVIPSTAARPGISTDVFKIADSMGIPYNKDAYAEELAARQVKGEGVPASALAEADRLLQHPAINIRMGDEYLYKMGQRNNGDLELAAAGYNAGQGGANLIKQAREANDFTSLPTRLKTETVPYMRKVMGEYAPGVQEDMNGFLGSSASDIVSSVPKPLREQTAEEAMAALGESRMPLTWNESQPLKYPDELPPQTRPVDVMTTDVTDYGNEDDSAAPTMEADIAEMDKEKGIGLERLEPKSPYGVPKPLHTTIVGTPTDPNAPSAKESLVDQEGNKIEWLNPDDPYIQRHQDGWVNPDSPFKVDLTGDPAKDRSLTQLVTDMFTEGDIDGVTSWLGSQLMDVIDYSIDQIDTDAVKSAAFNYLASRAIGYNHDSSANYAMKKYQERVKVNNAAQVKRQEKALDMLADGKINATEYAAIVNGETSIAGAIAGGVAGTAEGRPSALQITRAITAAGGDTGKAPKEYVVIAGGKGYAGRVVTAYDSPRGPVFYNQKNGQVETLAEGSYVKYTGDLHDPLELRKNLNQEMGRYATEHGKEKIAISGEEDGVKTRTSVEKLPVEYSGLVASVLSRAKNRFGPRGDLMYITSEGAMDIQKYYDAAWAFQQKTGKKVRNWEGFIDSIESGLRDVETGKIRVEQLDVDNDKEYSKLDKELQRVRQKGIPGTDGNRINRIVSIFNSTKPAELLNTDAFSHLNDAQKKAILDLRAKTKKKDYKVKEGSSAMMQFAQSYLKLL
jgi:hypothetical protein